MLVSSFSMFLLYGCAKWHNVLLLQRTANGKTCQLADQKVRRAHLLFDKYTFIIIQEAPVNSSYCDVSCPNDPVEQCGGLAYDSVYSSFVPDHTSSHDSVPNFLSPQMPATVEQRRPVSPYIVAIYCVVAFIVICFLAFFFYIWRMARKRTVPLEETKELEKCERRSLWSQSFVDKFRHYSTRREKIHAPV
ncbi:hypothetical protein INT44_005507 [Umbelopsis vinacea]|uniref:WSC domain-containing protein n=1 Tax=Umbelopsis vinacea TaxID=44442 RepID=A0A8H7Q873_9FUNG|nr:hypothetical protein INT44_005507 [Umbelopsis vinacea]